MTKSGRYDPTKAVVHRVMSTDCGLAIRSARDVSPKADCNHWLRARDAHIDLHDLTITAEI